MTVVLRHNQTLELNLVEYRASVTLAELKALSAFLARNDAYLRRDCLNFVLPDADFRSIDLPALDDLFAYYGALFAPLKLQIFRRAAWVCQSEAALQTVRYWLDGRDMRERMSSAVRRFDTLGEAGDWLVLSDAELDMVARGQDFDEIARFDIAANATRAAAR